MGLFSVIRNELRIEPDSNDGRFVAELCIKYLAGVSTAYDFQREIKRIDLTNTRYSGKTLRLMLLDHAYFVLNLKFAALNLALRPSVKLPYELKKSFHIKPDDVKLLTTMFGRSAFKKAFRAAPKVSVVNQTEISAFHMLKATSDFNHYGKDVTKYIKTKVYQKLRFIMEAENIELGDLMGDVLEKAIKSYYYMIPSEKTPAHITNYLRRSCANHITNMVYAATTEKRGRALNEGADGFGGSNYGLRVMSENQIAKYVSGEVSYDTLIGGATYDTTEEVDSEIFMSKLFSRFKGTKLATLKILVGEHNQKFTDWLKRNERIKDSEDHTDLQNRLSPKSFIKLLASFFKIKIEAFTTFVQRVGDMLKSQMEYA